MENQNKNITTEKAKSALNENALMKGHSEDDGHDQSDHADGVHDHGGVTAKEKPAWLEHWDLLLSLLILTAF